MAHQTQERNFSPVLDPAKAWIRTCLIEDRSLFLNDFRWTGTLVAEVDQVFVTNPDYSKDNFMTKLKKQMKGASPNAQQLMAEMLWALLLFPSTMEPSTKRQQIREIWTLSGQELAEDHPLLNDSVLIGIGSSGQGFNFNRSLELKFLIGLTRDLKQKDQRERLRILSDYDAFIEWIKSAPQSGNRQFRHILRFFSFPDRVERISSNNDRQKILKAFNIAPPQKIKSWTFRQITDKQIDDAIFSLRTDLEKKYPSKILDFYDSPLKEQWSIKNLSPTTEAQYQRAVLKNATASTFLKEKEEDEPEGPLPRPQKNKGGVSSSYQRDAKVAAKALRKASFQCEITPTHETFISSAKGQPYIEAHHLVPIGKQDNYDVSLDVSSNIVALCPLCHKRLHHGRAKDKKDFLKQLLSKRAVGLRKSGIFLDEETLLSYYSKDLLEEEA